MPAPILEMLGLGQNAALLVLGILGYCSLKEPLSRWPRRARGAAQGLIFGLLAIVSVTVPLCGKPGLQAGLQIDSRAVMIALCTVFGGPFAGLLAGAMTAIYGLWIGGVAATTGFMAITS